MMLPPYHNQPDWMRVNSWETMSFICVYNILLISPLGGSPDVPVAAMSRWIEEVSEKRRVNTKGRPADESNAVADPGFSQGGAPTPKSAIIFQIFAKNCMKWKNLDPQGGGARPWRPP